ncbi:TolC family protein [Elizabethkingia anophelis]|nr:TolC family protein [Elizabethkingia anophelis]
MSIRLSSIFILFNVFFIVQIKAQEKFDLKQCIDYGLKNNPSSVISFNDKRIADAKAKESLAAYLPNLNFSGTVDDNLKVQEQVIPAGLFGDQDIRVAFTKKFTTNGSVQLDQTIYDQSQILALNANKLLRQQADLNLKKTKESVIYNISTSYYQIFVYQEQLELLKINLETYSKQLEIVALKVKKGVALQKDMDKVQVDYNNTLSAVRKS